MATDDYRRSDDSLGDLERSQLESTRIRRERRKRRYYRLLFAATGLIALLVLAAPSIFSHTGLARSLLSDQVAAYGWQAEAQSIDVGWITPLKIRQLTLVGPSGETKVELQQIDSSLTVMSLLRWNPRAVGELTVRGAVMEAKVHQGSSSIENDLAAVLDTDESESSNVLASVKVQDIKANLTDTISELTWAIDQSNVTVLIDGPRVEGEFAGALGEPNGNVGAIQSQFEWTGQTPPTGQVGPDDVPKKLWELSVDTESFPMSTLNLIARRFAAATEIAPAQYAGETTGRIQLVGGTNGAVQASLTDVRIRDLQTIDQSSPRGTRAWTNELATLDGQVSLAGGWLFGHGLEMTTDFASATLDGAFPTTMTLTGRDDNPVSWLQSLDGTARVDVDLAALDRALPGVLPLRDGATLIQGLAHVSLKNDRVELSSTSSGTTPPTRRSNLRFVSDAIRARSGGRPVVIDPIELTATVVTEVDENGQQSVRAEQFSLQSEFATASGSGNLQNGSADFQMDFGRLHSMLRPIVDLAETSLGGTAEGKVRWNVARSRSGPQRFQRWELEGDGQANGLLVTLPNGHRFERAIVRGELSAVGQFQRQSLRELTSAQIAIHSGGVAARAKLLEPVAQPNSDSLYPIQLTADGRLENLSESLRPWIPESIRNAQGRVIGTATVKANPSQGTIQKVSLDLSQPQIAYGGRWYSQPQVALNFDGSFQWPSGEFNARDFRIVSDAVTLQIKGRASQRETQLEVDWTADLKRLQESSRISMARAKKDTSSQAGFQAVSFRPVKVEPYRYAGICKGRSTIRSVAGGWRINSNATGKDLAIYRPLEIGITPPGSLPSSFNAFPGGTNRQRDTFESKQALQPGDAIWHEPELKVSGPIEYATADGTIKLVGIEIANDWIAGKLSGNVTQNEEGLSADLSGPTNWNLPAISQRLSELMGTRVLATGNHHSELEIQFASKGSSPTFRVTGEVGWDRCQVVGVDMGKANLPFRLDESKLRLASTRIPLNSSFQPATSSGQRHGGEAVVAADVFYNATPMTIRLDRGARIDSLRVNPNHASSWLQYVAPLAAGATRVDGVLGAEFDEAVLVVDDPTQSTVRGRLNIEQLNVSSGPLADQLVQGIRQIKSIADPSKAMDSYGGPKVLIEMPPQKVEFGFVDRVATHDRLFFQIDRAQLMSSGRVKLNSEIQLVAQVPLDARWLGSDLKGLAGQTITLPINGTLSQPRLDVGSLSQMMAQVGVQAGQQVIQKKVDGFIQKQLGSGLDQINEQLGSGIEKIFKGF